MSPLFYSQPSPKPHQVYRMPLLQNSRVASKSGTKKGTLSFRA